MTQRHDQTKERTDMAAKWIEILTGSLEEKKQYKQDKARIDALPEPYGSGRQGDAPVLHVLRRHHRRRHAHHDVRRPRRPVGARRGRRDARCATSSATTRSSSPRRSPQAYTGKQLDRQGARAPEQGDRGRGASRAEMSTRCRHPGEGPGEVVQGPARAARRRLRRRAGQHLRPARLERGGQDDGRAHPLHAAEAGRGHRRR